MTTKSYHCIPCAWYPLVYMYDQCNHFSYELFLLSLRQQRRDSAISNTITQKSEDDDDDDDENHFKLESAHLLFGTNSFTITLLLSNFFLAVLYTD